MVEREKIARAIASWAFCECQPDKVDIFSWLDDRTSSLADAILAAIPHWRPISEADENVERCFLWCSDRRRDGSAVGLVMGRITDGTPYGDGMNGDWTFTHWMPLPSPPGDVE